ncbi:hypothetical protein PTTG_12698 [Puccinia triticina 1-1 BBBD Race 1]|uniref:Uncharacterized protein n=2 Tax=Puccinia triticina TaxID=208348 RepID=A0A180GJI8_PUCT1|nr:hypothetical protein PTTG_12698 [Puccinia triticina 1-1 BBBD Race 1]WAR55244.1 hypothetical protein PtB15_4B864 [Puccinia triticina]
MSQEMMDINLLLGIRRSSRPLILSDFSIGDAEEANGTSISRTDEHAEFNGPKSLERIRRLTETILSVDRPRKLSGMISEDPFSGKIPEFKFLRLLQVNQPPDPPSWFQWLNHIDVDQDLDKITLDSVPDDVLQAEQWASLALQPPQHRSPSLHPAHSKSPPSDQALKSPTKKDHTLVTPDQHHLEGAGQSDEIRFHPINAGLGLSECNLLESQLPESYDLEDITKFVRAEDQDYLSQF